MLVISALNGHYNLVCVNLAKCFKLALYFNLDTILLLQLIIICDRIIKDNIRYYLRRLL